MCCYIWFCFSHLLDGINLCTIIYWKHYILVSLHIWKSILKSLLHINSCMFFYYLGTQLHGNLSILHIVLCNCVIWRNDNLIPASTHCYAQYWIDWLPSVVSWHRDNLVPALTSWCKVHIISNMLPSLYVSYLV